MFKNTVLSPKRQIHDQCIHCRLTCHPHFIKREPARIGQGPPPRYKGTESLAVVFGWFGLEQA